MASSLVAEKTRPRRSLALLEWPRRQRKVAHTSAAERLCSTTSFDPPPRKKRGGGEGLERRRPKAHLTSVATQGAEARAGVPAGAKRREPRRGWRARAAPEIPEEHPGGFEGETSGWRCCVQV